MAREYGVAASYPTKQRDWILKTGVAVFALTEATLGFIIGFSIGKNVWWISWGLIPVTLAIGSLVLWWLDHDRDRFWNFIDGARGEQRVAAVLRQLPDEYHVVHGIETAFGDIDHLVMGPTGIFCLDAKHWPARITSDGKGELLYNGQPTEKPFLRGAVRRAMTLRERMGFANGEGPYFQTALVFVGSNLKVQQAHKSVDCLRVEELTEYVLRQQGRKTLSADMIDRLVVRARDILNG